MALKNEGELPDRFIIGGDLNWDAPWTDVQLWVELPFWLMVDNTTITAELEGHEFQVAVHDNYFELHGAMVTDSRMSVAHIGPRIELDDLPGGIQEFRRAHPEVPLIWRKCKTVLKIASRCNEDVWAAGLGKKKLHPATVRLYLEELCKAHIPVVNRVVQGYRQATYDYFAFEVAPWDAPVWQIEQGGKSLRSLLVPYRGWDEKPFFYEVGAFSFKPPIGPTSPPKKHQLISAENLQKHIPAVATPGEFELLDALNLMERGDYTGAVRRITTAIEVIVEAVVGKEVEAAEGKAQAEKFLNKTKLNFDRRVSKYEALSNRVLSDGLRKQLAVTRDLRHRIVHAGYRIGPAERGPAQMAIDTGRWTFNWFDNDNARRRSRESSIGLRSLGRDLTYGIFPSKITPEGVVVSPIGKP